ncbi:SDR family oxidoreductase [Massilia sp. PAMC28688]|uniref:SDR family NAD(P)-dependent oxidoreductase n=1 Tax=Massilia sp. PAMC28688 TaxID=2861283 RepID=UPI001C62E721|nr:SDR family oxidoreductase [Massilia sp. PAMC28688]QYF96128.1 SDR family oxidoreductase [Massilia sp. PAMC28688]
MDSFARYPSLAGKVVFVTGGGSGIGADIVVAYARQGALVAFADRDRDASLGLVAALEAEEVQTPLFIECDLTDMDRLKAAIAQAVSRFGDIDILVNNTASDARHAFSAVTPEHFDAAVAINLKVAFFASQAVVDGMVRKGGGSIINLGSCSYRKRIGGYAAYATLKASVIGLTRSLAREFGPGMVRVNTLTPGWVMTPRQLAQVIDAEAGRQLDADQCLPGRLVGTDIANMALFLGAADSRMVTAQEFVVDAGWS